MPVVMPDFYRPGPKPGLELPLYWRDDVTGMLIAAVDSYLAYRVDKGPAPNPQQTELLRNYCEHYINAPAWTTTCRDAFDEELARLRDRIRDLRSADEIAAWIVDCMDIGLDPL